MKCEYCKKEYMMDWAYQNHKKVCVFQFRKNEKIKKKK